MYTSVFEVTEIDGHMHLQVIAGYMYLPLGTHLHIGT